jgi:hypothetical protein
MIGVGRRSHPHIGGSSQEGFKQRRSAAYLRPFRRILRRDFLRSAVALCSTPALAALSKAEVTARSAVAASAFLLALMSVRYFLSSECRRDLMLRLWAFLRALFRMRRSADFVFGIIGFVLNSAAHGTETPAVVNGEAGSFPAQLRTGRGQSEKP